MGSGEARVRYAPYLEDAHKQLVGVGVVVPINNLFQALNTAFYHSPYKDGFDEVNIDRGFFGVIPGDPTRSYKLENFPSLWDMFGKFMGGMDLHTLWSDVYEDVVHGPEVAERIAAHSAMLFDELETRTLPAFLSGMRDINAIQSSAFIIGKSLLYDTHTKAVNEFATTLRVAQLDLSFKMWNKHLDWNTSVISTYQEMYKTYFTLKMDNDARQLEYKVKDALWDLGLFEYARAFIGALNGASATVGRNEPSQATKAIAGTLSGAAAGAAATGGNPYGIAAGAALGLASSFM